MGLFDRRKAKSGGTGDLSEYEGMRVEVMDEETGRLLFVARVRLAWDGSLELQTISGPRLEGVSGYLPVVMRGYEDSVKKAVHMEAELTPRDSSTWRVSGLRITGKDNDRAFYRQETATGGDIMPIRQVGLDSEVCRLVNISAGGVCLLSPEEYKVGEKLLLRANPLEGLQLAPLICVVRRVTRRKNGFEYGCEFTEITPAVEDAIAKAIMDMQLKRMRRE
ncbi:MAG: PilZ domain-containing protein [Oscillospiraceae bacterium]|nr:PilZ domain-containing protein [Oscillospiraceae bacterium]